MDSIGEKLQSAQEAVYALLKEQIVSGQLRGGDALRQEDLARRLGVSRLPLREALHRLNAEGLVVLRPRRGYVVATLNTEEIRDIFDIRILLEERAGKLAAKHRTQEDIDAVAAIFHRMHTESNVRNGIDKWSVTNREFHARLYQSSRRKHLTRVVNMLRDTVEPYIRLVALESGELERAHAEHQQIFEAFAEGDGKIVGRLCRDHCAYTAKFLIDVLDRRSQA